MREINWNPGDVAMATFDHGQCGLVFRVAGERWCDLAGKLVRYGEEIVSIRKVVVLDPESDEQVEELARLVWHASPGADWGVPSGEPYPAFGDDIRAALLEMAYPTATSEPDDYDPELAERTIRMLRKHAQHKGMSVGEMLR